MDEIELKKIEERIKRFGKVEPVEETNKRDNYRKNFREFKSDNNNESINKPEKKQQGNYLFIRKANFDNEESNETQKEQQIIPIKPKIFEEKKKEDYFIKLNETPKFMKKRLIIFGVNLMSSEDIEDYFGRGKIKKMYWLNDYSCVVEFDNEETSLSIFEELTNYKIDENKTDVENFDWKPSKSFKINDRDLELLLRVSDEEDILKKSSKRESKFYSFYNKRRRNHKFNSISNDDRKNKTRERSRSRDRFLEEKEVEQNKESNDLIDKF